MRRFAVGDHVCCGCSVRKHTPTTCCAPGHGQLEDAPIVPHAPLVALLDAALTAITLAEDIDQARGIAHAALAREEYHGHEAIDG